MRGALEQSREAAHRVADTNADLELRHLGELGRDLSALYRGTADALNDAGRMAALWERELKVGPGESGELAAVGAAQPVLHWDARKGLNTVKRWADRQDAADAARLREEAFCSAAAQQAALDIRRRTQQSKYRV